MHSRWSRALPAFFTCLGILAAFPAHADESPFATIYTTETLPAGGSEIEQWLTYRNGKPHESFNTVEGVTEYEYGLTNKLQVSGYLHYAWSHERPHTGGAGETGAKFTGVSGEVIYRIWDVYTHPIGIGVYFEPMIGPDTREIESKLLLQKDFLEDRLVLAANLVLENEWNRVAGNWEKNTDFNILAGIAYRFAPGWSGGIEFASQREYDGILPWQHSHAAANSFFLGPALHYANANYFVTLGAQAQLPCAENLSGEPGETVGGFAHEEERYRAILKIGIEL